MLKIETAATSRDILAISVAKLVIVETEEEIMETIRLLS
jgi:hypothetical protein